MKIGPKSPAVTQQNVQPSKDAASTETLQQAGAAHGAELDLSQRASALDAKAQVGKVLDNETPLPVQAEEGGNTINPLTVRFPGGDDAKALTTGARTFGFMIDLARANGTATSLGDRPPVANPNDYPHVSLTPPGRMDFDEDVYVIDNKLILRESGMGPGGMIQSKWTDCGPVQSEAQLKKIAIGLVDQLQAAGGTKVLDGAPVDDPNEHPHFDVTPDGLMDLSKDVYYISDRVYLRNSGMGPGGQIRSSWMELGALPVRKPTHEANLEQVKAMHGQGGGTALPGAPVDNINDYPSYALTPDGLMDMSRDAFLVKGEIIVRQSGMGSGGIRSSWSSLGDAPPEMMARIKDVLADAVDASTLSSIDGAPKDNINDYPHYSITPDGLMDMSKEAYLVDDTLYMRQSGMGSGGAITSRWFECGAAPKL